MELDTLLKFIHVTAAAVWIGSGALTVLHASHANKTGQHSRMIEQMEWVGPRIGGPVSLLIPVTGAWLVARNGSFEFTDPWVLGGIAGFVLLFAVGVGFHGPNYKRIARAGAESSEGLRLIRRGFAAARLEVFVLLVVMGLMVFKP